MKKRLVFEYDDAVVHDPVALAYTTSRKDRGLIVVDGRIEDAEPEKPEPLKPCPFCGGEAVYRWSSVRDREEVGCMGCGVFVPDDAAWNRRAS